MVFDSYLLPSMPNHTKSILDYDVLIDQLRPEATYFVPAETGTKENSHKNYFTFAFFKKAYFFLRFLGGKDICSAGI